MIDDATLYFLTGKFFIGVLFFIRIAGMFTAAPIFKNSVIPAHVKLLLSIGLAIIVTTTYWEEQPQLEMHLWYMGVLAIKEFMVGVAIGFSANMAFFAARFAGGLIDFDMGYHTSMMFNRDETSPTLVGEFKTLTMMMLFLFINGHHFIIEAVYASARIVPLTTFAVSGSTIALFVKMATSVLIIGVKMSAPLLVALFLTNLSLALLARVAPQTNIFILSFQLKVAVGLLVLFASVPVFVLVAKYSLGAMESETMKILMSLNPANV